MGDANGNIRVWNIDGKSISKSMGGHNSIVTEMIRNGDVFYSFGMDNTKLAWNI